MVLPVSGDSLLIPSPVVFSPGSLLPDSPLVEVPLSSPELLVSPEFPAFPEFPLLVMFSSLPDTTPPLPLERRAVVALTS